MRDLVIRVVGIAVVVGILWVLFTRIVDWGDITAAIGDLTASDWLLLAAVTAARLAIEPLVLMGTTPGLRWPRALPAFLAPAAAVVVVPGPSDLAARYAMYRSWGYSRPQTSASVMLVFLYPTFAKIALPAAAVGLLLVFGRSNAQLATVAVIAGGVLIGAIILFALLLRSERTARRLGHGAGIAARRIASWFRIKTPETLAADLADQAAHFRDHTGDVIRRRSHLASGASIAAQAGLFAILLASVRAVGITSAQISWVSVFAAFALVQTLTTIPITPSGLGVAEAAYVAFLAAESVGDLAGPIAAATIIYRVLGWLILIPLGGASWLWWTRSREPDESP